MRPTSCRVTSSGSAGGPASTTRRRASDSRVVDPGGVDYAADTVAVTPLGPFTPADWPVGSVLIRPRRGAATAADPLGPDLPLVAPFIRDHLAASGIPLNRVPPSPARAACARDGNTPQPALNLPAGLPPGRPALTAEIVGLYDGGARYFCGVYRPTGICLMRRSDRVYRFCPVCRYVMVDAREPTMHRVIDADYETLGTRSRERAEGHASRRRRAPCAGCAAAPGGPSRTSRASRPSCSGSAGRRSRSHPRSSTLRSSSPRRWRPCGRSGTIPGWRRSDPPST